MANSTKRDYRKKIAKDLEDEILTINTEIENLVNSVKVVNFKELRRLNIAELKNIRQTIQLIGWKIKEGNRAINNISNYSHLANIEEINGQEILLEPIQLRHYLEL